MFSLPLHRGAAVVAMAGSALSLVGAASSDAQPTTADPADVAGATVLRMGVASPDDDTTAEQADDAAVEPTVEPVPPEPEPMDVDELVKAVQLAEQESERAAAAERAAAEERAERAREQAEQARQEAEQAEKRAPGPVDCGLSTAGLGAVKSHVRTAAGFLGCQFGEPRMLGVAGRGGPSDHPGGRAIDFMVDRATGDALAECALRNKEALGITYVIWKQRINHGGDWKAMADRGSATANHFDHVHVSFGSSGGSGGAGAC